MIPLSNYLIVAAIMFCLSMAGIILNRKNLIVLLMSIELMLLAVNINFVAFSHYLQDTAGQVFGLFEKMAGSGKTIVMVTHDDELAARMPRMVAIADGRIVEDSGALARAPALALA